MKSRKNVASALQLGRLKMREWKMRYGQNARVENAGVDSKGGKCKSSCMESRTEIIQ